MVLLIHKLFFLPEYPVRFYFRLSILDDTPDDLRLIVNKEYNYPHIAWGFFLVMPLFRQMDSPCNAKFDYGDPSRSSGYLVGNAGYPLHSGIIPVLWSQYGA
jgi:hypothetical protein